MSTAPTRIACVGASITFGLGLTRRREECYPAVLGRLLGERARVRNFGYSGATAGRATNEPYWRTPSMTSAERFDPQMVVLMLGTNDAQHANRSNLPRFEADFVALIDHFLKRPACERVVIVSPPPVFDPLPEIDIETLDTAVRPAIEQVAADHGRPLVDGYSPLRDRPDLFPDNLHPDAEAAGVLAERVSAVVQPLMTPSGGA